MAGDLGGGSHGEQLPRRGSTGLKVRRLGHEFSEPRVFLRASLHSLSALAHSFSFRKPSRPAGSVRREDARGTA